MQTYLDYARRGQNAWWRYLVVIVAAVVGATFIDIVIGVVLTVARVVPRQTLAEAAQPAYLVPFLIVNGLVCGSILIGLMAMMRLMQGKHVGDVFGVWRWQLFAAGAGVWTVCVIVGTLADFLLRPSGFHWTASGETLTLAIVALPALGVQTLMEEFIFRGWLTQGLLLATRRALPAAFLSGILFGALHIPNGIPQAVNATLVGVVGSLIAIRTGGIAFTWGLHLVNNLFGAVVVVSAADIFKGSPGLITQTTPGLLWWDVVSGVALLAVPLWFVVSRLSPREGPAGAA